MRRRTAVVAGVLMIAVVSAVGVLWWYFDLGHEHVEKLPSLHGKIANGFDNDLSRRP
jgi:hypothetical protein